MCLAAMERMVQPPLAFLRCLQYITLANSFQRRLAYLDPGDKGNAKCCLHPDRTSEDSTDCLRMHGILKPTHHAKSIAAALSFLLKCIYCCFRCLFPNLLYQITFDDAQRFRITEDGTVSLRCTQSIQGKCDLASLMTSVDPRFW